jgi:hypothetical protein
MQNNFGRKPKKLKDDMFSKTKKVENEQLYLKRKSNEYSKKD